MSKEFPMDYDGEAAYIEQQAAYSPPLDFKAFSYNMYCFRRYCRMQQRAAARNGNLAAAARIRAVRAACRGRLS
jgi:hypothetical protein